MDRRLPARLTSRVDLSDGLAIFRFDLEEELVFEAGQYATLQISRGEKTVSRPYSIASSPREVSSLEFYISRGEEESGDLSLWDPAVRAGPESTDPPTTFGISGPAGSFLLDPSDARDLVFLAAGTGLAPFMSMIRKLNDDFLKDPGGFRPRRVCVIHGVRRPIDLGFGEELQALASRTLADPRHPLALIYIPTVSRPHLDPSWKGSTGRAETLLEDPEDRDSPLRPMEAIIRGMLRTQLRPETHVVYVCGHPGTIRNTVRILSARGFRPDIDLKQEKYS